MTVLYTRMEGLEIHTFRPEESCEFVMIVNMGSAVDLEPLEVKERVGEGGGVVVDEV